MPNTSSRKRPISRAQTQKGKGFTRPDVLTSNIAQEVRRSARIAQRRSIEEASKQQIISPQTTSLQNTGQRDKKREINKQRGVDPSAPSRASRRKTQTSLIKGKPTARALSAQRGQTGSNEIVERVTTAERSSRGKRGRERGGGQRTSLERKASEASEAVSYQLREDAQGEALSQPSASREKSSQRQTEAAETSRQAAETSRQAAETSRQPEETSRQLVETSRQPTETLRQPAETSRQPEEISRRPPPDTEQTQQKNPAKEAQVLAWAYQVASPSLERVDQEQVLHELDIPFTTSVDMNTDMASSTNYIQSAVGAIRDEAVKVNPSKLKYRRISLEPIPGKVDPKLEKLSETLKTQLPERTIAHVPRILELLREYVKKAEDNQTESCYTFIDELSFELDKAKSSDQLPMVTRQYFQANLKRCLAMNEAVLQRTIMMNIFSPYWLDKKFDWNAEGQWSQEKDSRIPSRLYDTISQPKPDLAISFTRQSFIGFDFSDPIPPALEKCISPEGDDRCFPFLLIEAKKVASDLQEAYLTNLHNASQALFNMYQWMVQANEVEKFEDQIRVFTLVLNAQDIYVRVHRCKQEADGKLYFYFEELKSLVRYSRDEAWMLVSSILEDYAAKELHPALEAAYKAVVKQMDRMINLKRKAEAAEKQSAKTLRHTGADDTNSLGFSALET